MKSNQYIYLAMLELNSGFCTLLDMSSTTEQHLKLTFTTTSQAEG